VHFETRRFQGTARLRRRLFAAGSGARAEYPHSLSGQAMYGPPASSTSRGGTASALRARSGDGPVHAANLQFRIVTQAEERLPELQDDAPDTLKDVVCPQDGGGLAERRNPVRQVVLRLRELSELQVRGVGPAHPRTVPQCGKPYLLSKYSKREGPYIACPDKECGYRREGAGPGGEQAPPQSAVP